MCAVVHVPLSFRSAGGACLMVQLAQLACQPVLPQPGCLGKPRLLRIPEQHSISPKHVHLQQFLPRTLCLCTAAELPDAGLLQCHRHRARHPLVPQHTARLLRLQVRSRLQTQ